MTVFNALGLAPSFDSLGDKLIMTACIHRSLAWQKSDSVYASGLPCGAPPHVQLPASPPKTGVATELKGLRGKYLLVFLFQGNHHLGEVLANLEKP